MEAHFDVSQLGIQGDLSRWNGSPTRKIPLCAINGAGPMTKPTCVSKHRDKITRIATFVADTEDVTWRQPL